MSSKLVKIVAALTMSAGLVAGAALPADAAISGTSRVDTGWGK